MHLILNHMWLLIVSLVIVYVIAGVLYMVVVSLAKEGHYPRPRHDWVFKPDEYPVIRTTCPSPSCNNSKAIMMKPVTQWSGRILERIECTKCGCAIHRSVSGRESQPVAWKIVPRRKKLYHRYAA